MADRVGQHLGNYRLVRLLGEGGFAEVYLGEHVHLGTQAAIKVLSAKLQSEEVEGFREEARMIAGLRHPAIVRVLDFGVEGGIPYLVMDYAVNGTLRQRYPKGTRLAPAIILPHVRQVASALQYAHERKLIHRDVKPENMLVGEHGEVLLSDFGIAIVAQSSRYQSAQDVVGTLAYMAPEQIQAHPRPASDQYSLGIVLYEWLMGERPFTGSMREVLAKQLSVPPPPLREKLPTISPELEQVVLTALAKDPKERFASVQAFAIAFEQVCQAEGPFFAPTQRMSDPAPVLSTTIPVSPGRAPTYSEPVSAAAPTPTLPEPTAPERPPMPALPVPAQRGGGISRRAVLLGGGTLVGLTVIGGGIWLVNAHTAAPATVSARATATGATEAPAVPPTVTGEVVTLSDGLQYVDITVGTGATVKEGDTINVQYTGWLQATGVKIDSSYDDNTNGQPIQFTLAQGELIQGWVEGIPGMKVGGRRRLIIPPALAYGANGNPPQIPPNATLIYDVQVVSIVTASS